jgi:hypothetical protein
MPKRGKQGEDPPRPAPADDDLPLQADLDLDSEDEDELADDEIDSGSDSGSESDDEVREALAGYLQAAAAGRPAGARGDGQRATTSDGDTAEEDDDDEEGTTAEGGRKRCGDLLGGSAAACGCSPACSCGAKLSCMQLQRIELAGSSRPLTALPHTAGANANGAPPFRSRACPMRTLTPV